MSRKVTNLRKRIRQLELNALKSAKKYGAIHFDAIQAGERIVELEAKVADLEKRNDLPD